ncbi:MAG TPA: hypothetical protein VLI54_01045 [Bacillota bacterium]|nr:hypothetical protein [Bacillota bacterium]
MAYAETITQHIQHSNLPILPVGETEPLGSVRVDDPLVRRTFKADVTTVELMPKSYPSEHGRLAFGFLYGIDLPDDPALPGQLHFVEAPKGSHKDLGQKLGVADYQKGAGLRFVGEGGAYTEIGCAYGVDVGGMRRPFVHAYVDARLTRKSCIRESTAVALSRAAMSLLAPRIFTHLSADKRDGQVILGIVDVEYRCSFIGDITQRTASSFELEELHRAA